MPRTSGRKSEERKGLGQKKKNWRGWLGRATKAEKECVLQEDVAGGMGISVGHQATRRTTEHLGATETVMDAAAAPASLRCVGLVHNHDLAPGMLRSLE